MYTETAYSVQRFLAHGGALYQLAQVDKGDLDILQKHATQLFCSGHNEKAVKVFIWLVTLDRWNIDYLLSTAICYQRLGQHERGLPFLIQAGILYPSDPRAAYYTAVSLEALGFPNAALRAYRSVIHWSKDANQPFYATLGYLARLAAGKLDLPLEDM